MRDDRCQSKARNRIRQSASSLGKRRLEEITKKAGIPVPHKIKRSGKGDSSMADTDVLTSKEAAAFLRITTRTLYRLAKAGIIPSARIGTIWRFNRTDLENYVRAMGSQQIDKHNGKHMQSLPVGFNTRNGFRFLN
jgi:excisionase family DNA binding protein